MSARSTLAAAAAAVFVLSAVGCSSPAPEPAPEPAPVAGTVTGNLITNTFTVVSLDHTNRWATLRHVVFPLIKTGLIAGAVFAFIGAQLRRPLLIGLFFIVGWEYVVLFLPGYLKRFTVAYYLQALVPHAMPQESTVSALQAFFRQPTSPLASLAALGAILVVSLVLAARAVERREYILEQ